MKKPPCLRRWLALLLWSSLGSALPAQNARWIAAPPGTESAAGDSRVLRTTFSVESGLHGAQLDAVCEAPVTFFLNGKEIAASAGPGVALSRQLQDEVRHGLNVLAARIPAGAGAAPALIAVLQIDEEYGKTQTVLSDGAWQAGPGTAEGWAAAEFDAQAWPRVLAFERPLPEADVFRTRTAGAIAASELSVPPGFKVELLRSAHAGEGSWVSMAIDGKGRLYLSPQGKEKMRRITLGASGKVDRVDAVELPITGAMGMLWAFDSLYVSGVGPEGQAIYRLRDTDGDDALDKAELFKKVPGGSGEHGAHAIVLGPDAKLYIAHGNATPLLEGVSATAPLRHWSEDILLPRIMDPVATFFATLKAPYGQVWRTDSEGRNWELFAGGFRNQYDMDFNAEGELFTYDSDMEWDVGLPWYRPTRILHVRSGAEFGFREGNAKWPEAYPDTLPAVVPVGLGCPTGVKFGTRSHFPAAYRSAFFAMDWTFGRILAVHMHERGASYVGNNTLPSPYDLTGPNSSADVESFLSGRAMPVSDLEFGEDGAMYFVVGGRGTQSGLYRVSYVGAEISEPATLADPKAAEARRLRRSLETFHGAENPEAVPTAWPALGSEDRAIRYAARLAIEAQPPAQWRERALAETEPRAALNALLALARCGAKADQEPLLKALGRFPFTGLDEEWKLNKLRVIELSFTRQGMPLEDAARLGREQLSREYPAASFALNRELCQVLVWLRAPEVVEKTLALLRESPVPAEQIWYASVLSEATAWTPAQRQEYLAWFEKARAYKGGNSFSKFIERVKEKAVAALSDAERAALVDSPPAPAPANVPTAPMRAFQKAWSLEELAPDLANAAGGRSFARGKELFSSLQCLQCHHFGGDGGNVGPDLSAVANRFSRRDLLESIIEPSKAISEQYASLLLTIKGGETLAGQIAEETPERLVLVTDPVQGTKRTLPKAQIVGRQISPLSLMPPGLLNVLKKDEILDLLAYLESAGNPKAPAFSAPPGALPP